MNSTDTGRCSNSSTARKIMEVAIDVALWFIHVIGGMLVMAYSFLLILSVIALDVNLIAECAGHILVDSTLALFALYLKGDILQ